jgi:hypothetical protein
MRRLAAKMQHSQHRVRETTSDTENGSLTSNVGFELDAFTRYNRSAALVSTENDSTVKSVLPPVAAKTGLTITPIGYADSVPVLTK